MRIWDVTDGRQTQIAHLKGHEGPVWKAGVGRFGFRGSRLRIEGLGFKDLGESNGQKNGT